LLGFAVKIPLVPLHTWLPDVIAEAPVPVSMIVTAVVLTVGAYGMVRVGYSVFPMQAAQHWFFVALIGVVSIVYGAVVALAQKDFKRLLAYASISQMGYVVLGIAVMTPMGTTGAIFQMLAHGISSAMMIFIAGVIFERAQHTEISRLGGIWTQMPGFTGWAIVGFFASMGVPGLCGFVGELLVLMGTFGAGNSGSYLMRHVGPWVYTQALWLGAAAAFAIILTTAYHLWTFQRVFMGEAKPEFHDFAGLTWAEKCILAVLGLVAIALGVLPMLVLEPIRTTIEGLMRIIAG
jgi:NADH-quinone oxidoreductase subunit M